MSPECPNIVVRRAIETDLEGIAKINSEVFLGAKKNFESALRWVKCWFAAFPVYQYFVILVDEELVGYIGWQIHGGFQRPEPAIELEQLGIHPEFEGRGLGPRITNESMKEVISWLKQENRSIESHVSFVVWGYSNNLKAFKIYLETFTDGPMGSRIKYGSRHETMFRLRIPIVRSIRD